MSNLKLDLLKLVGHTALRVKTNFSKKKVCVYFDRGMSISFFGCEIVYDLGIIGETINDVSIDAGLGMAMELENEDFLFCTLSKSFSEYIDKREFRISFKSYELNLTPPS